MAKNCVTMNKWTDILYEKTDVSDVIYDECSKLSGKIRKTCFERHHSVLKPPINIRILLQRSEYTVERDEYCKNKTKLPFHHNIPCLFQVKILH